MKRTFPTRSTFALLSLVACTLPDRELGALAMDSDGGSSGGAESTTTDPSTSTSDPSVTGAQDETGTELPPDCEGLTDPPTCKEDVDRDQVRLACDNAPDYFNPSQLDTDGDGVGDVVDLCPTVAGAQNSADSDKDGIGNDCDSCPSTTQHYNELAAANSLPSRAYVRNIPDVGDADGDGIGDACDNCVVVPNCEDYSAASPWAPGDEIARDDPSTCQRDDDGDMIGDACAGAQIAGAAGPVGFGHSDDFDQDGLQNALDGCFRLPLAAAIPCSSDDECGAGTSCEIEAGLCNHTDLDGDLVGDVCDTCATAVNGGQLEDGGMQEDDEDGDFVGRACETEGCDIRTDPAPMSFYTLSAAGKCCTTLLYEDEDTGDLFIGELGAPLLDYDDLPIRVDCVESDDPELRTCRRLPDAVAQAPGVLTLPPGCSSAGEPVGLADFDGDLGAHWASRCELPQWDQDFDGIGDLGDFCQFTFDPYNTPYTDDNGKFWPNHGAYCNGDYNIEATCGE